MKITPLDVINHRFKQKLLGYDKHEVEIYLEMIASEMEELAKENTFLTQELKRKSNQVLEYQERESTLKETLITAQKVAQDIKNNMVKEAQVILSEAEMEGERMVRHAQTRAIQLQDDIYELRRMRIQMENEIRSIVKTYQNMMEAMTEDETKRSVADDKLTIMSAKAAKR